MYRTKNNNSRVCFLLINLCARTKRFIVVRLQKCRVFRSLSFAPHADLLRTGEGATEDFYEVQLVKIDKSFPGAFCCLVRIREKKLRSIASSARIVLYTRISPPTRTDNNGDTYIYITRILFRIPRLFLASNMTLVQYNRIRCFDDENVDYRLFDWKRRAKYAIIFFFFMEISLLVTIFERCPLMRNKYNIWNGRCTTIDVENACFGLWRRVVGIRVNRRARI